MERVAIYLRKSRSETDSDTDELETLAKHRRALLKFAKDKSLNIVRIYEEVVSGERIASRPEMQALLNDVENGLYQAVLIMDMDRLGRGNMREQGLIIETFRESGTLIITPRKTYDLRNEMDEEYSEFEAFFARKELKIITRRMQSGRTRAAAEGNYLVRVPPFGYLIHKPDANTRTLIPHPTQADTVRMIFNLYTIEKLGGYKISLRLNELGIAGYTEKKWSHKRINQILKNKVYAGYVVWNRYKSKPHPDPEKKRKRTKRSEDEYVSVKGKHEPLITEEQFNLAQEMMRSRTIPSTRLDMITKNQFAGLVECGLCGWYMVRVYKVKHSYLKCNNSACRNRSVSMARVEEVVLKELQTILSSYKLKTKPKPHEDSLQTDKAVYQNALREWNELKRQKDNLHDLLERGVYSIEMYLERSATLAERIKEKEKVIDVLRDEVERKEREQKMRREFIPALIDFIKLYHKTKTNEQKNVLLKSVLHKIIFTRTDTTKNGPFELTIYPKLL